MIRDMLAACVVCSAICVAAARPRVSGVRVVEDGPEEDAQWDDICATTTRNHIVTENCKAGVDETEWGINAAGHSTIQGFATQQSYRAGENVEFKVKSTSTNYSVDIYRVGYYRGKGARLVHSVASVVPHAQPDCSVDEETLLVDCANWAVVASWSVPADAVTGVYFARLTRLDVPRYWRTDASEILPSPKFANPDWNYTEPPPCGYEGGEGRQQANCAGLRHSYGALKQRHAGSISQKELKNPFASHVYFVLREATPSSELLFQTSDPTWHAYNVYGAPNSYGGVALEHHWEHFPQKIQDMRRDGRLDNRRAFKRSYNVPMLTRDTRSVNMLWGVEYPMIRFLERHGYSVGYQSGVDTDAVGVPHASKVFLSVGHDEYWGQAQRDHIIAARDAGRTHLIFLSGNEAYWRIRFEDNHRTMAIYKETQSSTKLDPKQDEWTGTWRDAVKHNPLGPQPENEVTGTIWTVNAWRFDPLEVPYVYARQRFWRHSEVQRQVRKGQKAVLMRGLLGHEWDESIENGFRPRGGIRMSETTVHNVQHIYDGGSTFDSGSATHHLILYRAKSGVLVFGTGTVQWPWGLDGHHDSASGMPNNVENEYATRIVEDTHAPDTSVQQATINILQDMGVTPVAVLLPEYITLEDVVVDTTAPTCEVTRTERNSVGEIVRIHGTASDVGGTVASVEVCVAGGEREGEEGKENCKVASLASDGTSWHYAASPMDAFHRPLLPSTAATVACFAVDDSVNIGITTTYKTDKEDEL